MAVLIVDDESSTRDSLRDLLQESGLKPILEARNGQEALKVLDSEKSRVRAIIADWEMPYMDGVTLSQKVAELAYLDHTAFLLITSDLGRSRVVDLQEVNPRLDGCLVKPFRMKGLLEAVNEAQIHRIENRGRLVFLGSGDLTALRGAISKAKTLWAELEQTQGFQSPARDLGAIILDPKSFSENLLLQNFKRTPQGTATPVVCLGRESDLIFRWRTLAQYFIDPPRSEKDWVAVLNRLDRRLRYSWQNDLLLQESKNAIEEKKPKVALKIAKRMLRLDPENPETLMWLAEIEDLLEHRRQAMDYYERSITENPCLPRPYIKLFESSKSLAPERLAQLIENAKAYCPQNSDVLQAAEKSRAQTR